MLTLLVVGFVTLALHVQVNKAQGPIYIRADGSVDPPSAPISSVDNVTYTFTDSIYGGIVIERSNITVDGAGYTLQGENSEHGFYLSGVNNATIKNTNIQDYVYGVFLSSSSFNTVSENNIASNNYLGIYFSSSSFNTVSENNIENCAEGIVIHWSSNNNTVSGNNITHCQNGVAVRYYSSNNTISQNNIENGSEAGSQFGIEIYYLSNNTIISGNNIANHRRGAEVNWSYNNIFRNNALIGNQYGFSVLGDELESFIQDVDTSNTVEGKPIYYFINQENLVIDPSTYPNIGYLALVNSTNIAVRGMELKNNFQGLLLAYTNNSQIVNNTISHTWNIAAIYWSDNNRIYHNNFSNSRLGVDNYMSSNAWDDGYPSGGNHWSEYGGVDIKKGSDQNQHGSDGIGDTPYALGYDNEDRYPLMRQFGSSPPPMYTLTIAVSAGGSSDPIAGTYSYSQGQNVPIQAIPDPGYYLSYWELDGNNVGNSLSFVVAMDSPHTLIANFGYSAPPVPEFPLGFAFEMAFMTLIMYLWWKRKHRTSN